MEDRTRMGAPDSEENSNGNVTEIPMMPETKDPSDIWSGRSDDRGDDGVSGKRARKSTLMGDE